MKRRIFLFLLFILPALIGFVITHTYADAIVQMWLSGAFTRWENLGIPPAKAIDILDVGHTVFDTGGIYIRTEAGRDFYCCGSLYPFWQPATAHIDKIPAGSCEFTIAREYFSEIPDPPGKIIDCIALYAWEYVYDVTIFVILDDGSIWRWHNFVPFAATIVVQFLGPLFGLLFSVAVLIVRAMLMWIKNHPYRVINSFLV